MSDNIPFDIQIEIIKKVSNVKSLIQFRSVSKQWRSFIDSSEFINGYGARHTHPHSHILSYKSDSHFWAQPNYFHLVDDDVETFKVQPQNFAPFSVSSLLKQCHISIVIGESCGLLCLLGYNGEKVDYMLVIWNPSIGKSVGIALPRYYNLDTSSGISFGYGFGVCPVTSDPTVVSFECVENMPWYVEVFTLSSGVWNVIPSGNLPRQTIRLFKDTQVVIDKFIYWCASEWTYTGEPTRNHMVVSFDLITHEFNVVNLPDTLSKGSLNLSISFSVSNLRGSLVVCGYKFVAEEAGVWVMGNDLSFRKLFTICAPSLDEILGFKKNGETIFKTRSQNAFEMLRAVLDVYDPCSQQIKNLGISGLNDSFFMGSYKESLLLLDHLDSHIYYDNN